MKRTIEIDDTLDEIKDSVALDVRNDFLSYLDENPTEQDERDPVDDWWQFCGADRCHEIVDSSVPIYYSEIDGLWYLYSDEFEDAYKNAGIGSGDEDNHKQVAIYCYLEQEAAATEMQRLRELCGEWQGLVEPTFTLAAYIRADGDEDAAAQKPAEATA